MERVKKPLIHISKREPMPLWKSLLIRAGAVLIALIISATFISLSAPRSQGFFGFFGSLFSGAFGTERRILVLLQDTGLLLLVALALVVAFRMKFWNLGGNGQILMGCLASAICMKYLGGKAPDAAVGLLMFVTSLAAGAAWAVIPAVFKAFFNTNESLFTLMLNYVAMNLVVFFIALWYPTGSGAMPPLTEGRLPTMGGGLVGRYLPVILTAVIVTAAIFCYLRFTKHGYEIDLVGESKNTARYAGIGVKKVVIRTLAFSGLLCGLVGFLLVGSINYMVSPTMDGNMGFTGIMVAWLGKFNPLIMAGVAFFVNILSCGMASGVQTDFRFTSEAFTDIVIGLIYFFFIGCEFFIVYKVHLNLPGRTHGRPAPAFEMGEKGAQEEQNEQGEQSEAQVQKAQTAPEAGQAAPAQVDVAEQAPPETPPDTPPDSASDAPKKNILKKLMFWKKEEK